MDLVGIRTAMLSVSTPGTVPARDPAEAAVVSRDVNDFAASLVSDRPDRFGFFATVPLPDVEAATSEAIRALGHLRADGLILLANAAGGYLGSAAHDELFAELDARSAVALVHPATLPGPRVAGVPPFAADFLLDTTRAAYLLVRSGVITRFRAQGRVQYFAAGLDDFRMPPETRMAIQAGNAARLFPRLGVTPTAVARPSARDRVANGARRAAARAVFRLVQPH